MNETILMNTDVDKRAEIDDVPHRSGKLHPGLKIFDAQNIGFQEGLRRGVPWIASRLFQLVQNVDDGKLPASESFRRSGNIDGRQPFGSLRVLQDQILACEPRKLEQMAGRVIGFRMNAGPVKNIRCVGNAQKSRVAEAVERARKRKEESS